MSLMIGALRAAAAGASLWQARRPSTHPTTLLIVLLWGLFGALAAADVPAEGKYTDVVAELTKLIQHEVVQKKLPALSVALVDDKRVVWSAGYGFVDSKKSAHVTADTPFRIGQHCELATTLGLMKLIEQGNLQLDSPIDRILPDFQTEGLTTNKPMILRHVLSHRTGLPRLPRTDGAKALAPDAVSDITKHLIGSKLAFPPGEGFKYSEANQRLLRIVLGQHSKAPVLRLFQAKDFRAAGIADLEPEPSCQGVVRTLFGRDVLSPQSSPPIPVTEIIRLSANDLATILKALFANTVVKQSTFESMLTPAGGDTDGFGLGLYMSHLEGRRIFEHAEGVNGATAYVAGLPDEKLAVAIIINQENARAWTARIGLEALKLLAAYREGGRLPKISSSTAINWHKSRIQPGYYASEGTTKPTIRIERYQEIASPWAEDRAWLWPLTGGAPAEIRQFGDSLQTDDLTNFGTTLEDVTEKSLRIDEQVFHRLPDAVPSEVPERWVGLIGEYGFDAHWLIVLEEAGQLYALMDWHYLEPLKPIKDDEFSFLSSGRYASESVKFHRDDKGRSTGVTISGLTYPRRKFDGDGGTYRIQPVRPVDVLMKEALVAKAPASKGELATPDLVDLATLDPTLKFDIRYATANNFLGAPVYPVARALLQRPAAEALVKTHRELARDGYGLLIHDAYRPWHVTKVFWEATPQAQHTFVADPAIGSRHNRGCAVDLTLYDLKAGQAVNMPGGYDEFSDRSYPRYPGGTSSQRFLRDKLRTAMESNGFNVYEAEWWHFDYRDWKSYPILNVALSDFKR